MAQGGGISKGRATVLELFTRTRRTLRRGAAVLLCLADSSPDAMQQLVNTMLGAM